MTGAHNFIELHQDEAGAIASFGGAACGHIRTTNGTDVPLDNDLLAILEVLYKDVTVRLDLERTFEDMMREIRHLVEQMDPAERLEYLVESLFLNTVTYENERLGALIRSCPPNSSRVAGMQRDSGRDARTGRARTPSDLRPADFDPGLRLLHVSELPGHPLPLFLAVGDRGAAVRRPPRLRLRRSVREARAR